MTGLFVLRALGKRGNQEPDTACIVVGAGLWVVVLGGATAALWLAGCFG